MPKPKTKTELLESTEESYQKLLTMISDLGENTEKKFSFEGGNRNIRDVIAHVWEWQLMFKRWYEAGMNGEKPEMPAPGYKWKDTPELNDSIRRKHNKLSLNQVLANLGKEHASLRRLIESHTNEELFEKKRYKWTGSTSLGVYVTGATWSHYNWAMKLIKRHARTI